MLKIPSQGSEGVKCDNNDRVDAKPHAPSARPQFPAPDWPIRQGAAQRRPWVGACEPSIANEKPRDICISGLL